MPASEGDTIPHSPPCSMGQGSQQNLPKQADLIQVFLRVFNLASAEKLSLPGQHGTLAQSASAHGHQD